MIEYFVWIPVYLAPKEWEGKNVIIRNSPTSRSELYPLPFNFSRDPNHCGMIEVLGPLQNVLEKATTVAAEPAAVRDDFEGAVESNTLLHKAAEQLRADLAAAREEIAELKSRLVDAQQWANT
jgi:hypothetical protein